MLMRLNCRQCELVLMLLGSMMQCVVQDIFGLLHIAKQILEVGMLRQCGLFANCVLGTTHKSRNIHERGFVKDRAALSLHIDWRCVGHGTRLIALS